MSTPSFRPIRRVLIANRGEIAIRIARTCRRMGLETVMVFSEADADALHASAGDLAVCIGPADSRASYLNVEALLSAAARTGADAIHPGYGFLSENAGFAAAVEAAGLTFIGPPASAIEAMGSKSRAKAIAIAAGVPVVPGYQGEDRSIDTWVAQAAAIGYPVLIKASAGGGGKGMQIVESADALPAAIESARRVALAAFGDDTLLMEKYVTSPRHVEIQMFGDAHGNVVHLFERECSIQRRYQKIIEESPSVALDETLRARMGDAAVALGRAIGYRNAGTVEFIVAPDGAFYFLEVNTRLQVEHPVTEGVTGLDLVEHQIRVARGEVLAPALLQASHCGAALECRLYAEDPSAGFLPSSGTIRVWQAPAFEGLRIDTGFGEGSVVGTTYDPMLAKIITQGRDREEARLRMIQALEGLAVGGVRTNRTYLLNILRHPAYIAGDIHTHFLQENPELSAPAPAPPARAVAVAESVRAHRRSAASTLLPGLRPGFRLFSREVRSSAWLVGAHRVGVEATVAPDGTRHCAVTGASEGTAALPVRVLSDDGLVTVVDVDGVRQRWTVRLDGDEAYVTSLDGSWELVREPDFPVVGAQQQAGGYIAPMAGKVVAVRVAAGDIVVEGQPLVVLDAMKMEHTIAAREAGTVESVAVAAGDQVQTDQVLLVLTPA